MATQNVRSSRQAPLKIIQHSDESEHRRFPQAIAAVLNLPMNGETFLERFLCEIQEGMPKAASHIEGLHLEYDPDSGYHRLPPSRFAAVKLPALQVLNLGNVIVTSSALKAVLRAHKNTLRDLTLTNVALEIPRAKTGGLREVNHWVRIMRFIKDRMRLENLCVENLRWFNPEKFKVPEDMVWLPKRKYHRRNLDAEGLQWFRLKSTGLKAVGAVYAATNDWIREIDGNLPKSSDPGNDGYWREGALLPFDRSKPIFGPRR